MKPGFIKLSQEFLTPNGLKRWVGIEYPIDFAHEGVMEAYARADKMIQDYQTSWASNQQINNNELPVIQINEDKLASALVKDIMACNSLPVLQVYESMASGNPILESAYNKRKSQLT